jgi:hypothetical protein
LHFLHFISPHFTSVHFISVTSFAPAILRGFPGAHVGLNVSCCLALLGLVEGGRKEESEVK